MAKNNLGEDLLPGNPLIPITHPDFKRHNPNASKFKRTGLKAIVRDPLFLTTTAGLILLAATVVAL